MTLGFENKLVGIINREIETGRALNSLAHVSIVLGAQVGWDALMIENYKDQQSNFYPISSMPFIILKAKSSEIRKIIEQAKEDNMQHIAFLDTMTGGTYIEQMQRTSMTSSEDLKYYCAVLFGVWDKVSEMTRKLSLYK